ncbi:hypothetical protein COW46_01190 [Candidatus Gracilibacteria bacterium CG17_big_fil_post_rev_8_21_14_2_50_48_13]|nr:MAG: hypothetical protein COW46_01190 [Candidatus Gracilibacteria bacterium CG17_big_fil_post_rev_8_21_14_2_50_48_13]
MPPLRSGVLPYDDGNLLSLCDAMLKKILTIGVFILIGLLATIASMLFFPVENPLPAPLAQISYASFDDAIRAIPTLDVTESDKLRDDCRSIALHSGKKEARVVVLLHGYTNCPKQFLELGERIHAQGVNVLIPRAPGHGYADRATDALSFVTAKDFLTYTHASIAIADAMGDTVTLVGLSGGGTLTLWAALFEPAVDEFIAIAPVAYPRGFEPLLRNAVIRYAAWTPSEFSWWDKEQKERLPGPAHAYRGYASRSMGAILHIAAFAEQQLRPGVLSKKMTFIINEADKALREDSLLMLADKFARAGADVRTIVFEKALGYPHDLIDPENIQEKKDAVYDVFMKTLQ